MKTHWKKVFNKDYLGSHDLEEEKDLVATIDHVEVRVVKDSNGKDGNCNVAVFVGKIKPMILNVTNCKVIKKFTKSNYIEDWKNVPVVIYSAEVRAFGEVVEGLRIRDKQPQIKKEQLTPDHPMWSKAVAHMMKEGSKIGDIKKRYELTPEHTDLLINEAI